VAWLNKRATSVYADEKGLYPVVIRRSWNGITIVHDPNRALGPTTIYTAPSLTSALLEMLKIRQDRALGVQFPLPGSEDTLRRLSSQAHGIQLMSAATRPQGLLAEKFKPEQAFRLAQAITTANTDHLESRMPQITMVQDPAEVNRMLDLWEEKGAQ
jgi:hypothetical protein